MNTLQTFGFLSVVLSLSFAAYSLHGVNKARQMGRNPRPFAMAVFTLLAYSIMQGAWIISGYAEIISKWYAITWLLVDYALVASISWLIFESTKTRRGNRQ